MTRDEIKKPGKYLKKENLSQTEDTIVTVTGGEMVEMGRGNEKEEKFVVYFKELSSGLVVNNTNLDNMLDAHGVNDTDDLEGELLALYVDPEVMFGGERVGGIRVRREAPPAVGAPTYDLGDVPAPV